MVTTQNDPGTKDEDNRDTGDTENQQSESDAEKQYTEEDPDNGDAGETQPAPANNAAPVNTQEGEESGQPVAQSVYSVNVGNRGCGVQKGEHVYFTTSDGSVGSGNANNWNIDVYGDEDCVHVTLKDAVLTDTNSGSYPTVFSAQNLHVTLQGTNSGEGTVFSEGSLTIDGDGSLAIRLNRDTGWYTGFGAVKDLMVAGSAKLYFNNKYTQRVASGVFSQTSIKIGGNANITLEGNLESGIYGVRYSDKDFSVPVQMDGGTVQITGAKTMSGGGIGAGSFTINDGSLTIDETCGNGIYAQKGDITINNGNVTVKNTHHFSGNDSCGKALSSGNNKVIINNGTLICDKAENNDVFGADGIVINGGHLDLSNGESSLTSMNSIVMNNGMVTITNAKYSALSVLHNDIDIKGGTLTIDSTGSDAISTVFGNVNVTGGYVKVENCQNNGISLYQGSEDTHHGTIQIKNAFVNVAAKYNAFNAYWGNMMIGEYANITASSTDSNTIGCPDIMVTGNSCEVTLTSPVRVVGNAVKFESADQLASLGGTDKDSAVPVTPEEMSDCKYLHIFKSAKQPLANDNVVISTKNWTEGDTAVAPTVADKTGKALKARVYYKRKGAADDTYTMAVPTAAGEYETKLVVLGDETTYGTAAYYGAFTIAAKASQPTATPAPSNNSNTNNTSTNKAAPSATPAARSQQAPAKAAPAAVKAAIPQTSDAFPYAGLAALMGAAALGMAGVFVLRKKHQ